ncbi:MAG: alpha/beta hydrolase [Pseudomonadota bacterium]
MRRVFTITLILFLCVGLALTVSNHARFAVVNLPTLWFAGQITSDQVFDSSTGLSLDIYSPPAPGPHPVVIFWHGGSWQWGTKDDYKFVGMRLAEAGITVVLPDYRKYPDVRHPAFVEDAAAALAWTHANIAGHGGDPGTLVLSGHSAGAHIAALVANDPSYLAGHGLDRSIVAGVAGLAGPYDFVPSAKTIKAIFGPEDRYPSMQAGTFVDDGSPSILMMYGRDDDVVGMINIDRMQVELDRVDACYGIQLYDGVDHISIISSFTWVFRDSNPAPQDLIAFVGDIHSGRFCED